MMRYGPVTLRRAAALAARFTPEAQARCWAAILHKLEFPYA